MSISYLSTEQVINLWITLEDARDGEANYGAHIAEIYVSKTIPYDALAIAYAQGKSKGTLAKGAFEETYGPAWQGLREVLIKFQKTRGCKVYLSLNSEAKRVGKDFGKDWVSPKEIRGVNAIPATHRFYVKVSRYEY